MESRKNFFIGALLALCSILLVVCIVFIAGGSKAAANTTALPEVRNNGTAIQWKYSNETEWRDLVALADLRGAAGENGKDGSNGHSGENGKDGKNGKNIEVKRSDAYIQWRYEGGSWQNLVSLLDISGPAGANGEDGESGKTPEFRVNENTLQWRYSGDDVWLNLYDLSVLKGLDGKNGTDGRDGLNGKDGENGLNGQDGKNGDTPFIGSNGNWWIGTTDTGVKAAGQNGEKGDQGDKGDKGDKGDEGPAGQNAGFSGWLYAKGYAGGVVLKNYTAKIDINESMSSGGLISCYSNTVTLKKGHKYSLSMSGSIAVSANNDNGNYSVQMKDGYDDDFCRALTRVKRDGRPIKDITLDQYPFSFGRIYDATDRDITLRFEFEQSSYSSCLDLFNCTFIVFAID